MQDYYEKYASFTIEINLACDCVNSYRCKNLSNEINNIKQIVENLQVNNQTWDDSVADTVSSTFKYCANSLNDIIVSIDSSFAKSEELYESLKELLENLKNTNIAYQKKYKGKPDQENYYHHVKTGEDENGKDIYDYRLDRREYTAALDKWQREVKKLESDCENLIEQIESKKSELESINGEVINSQSISLFKSISNNVAEFLYYCIQNPEGNVSDYLKKNGGVCSLGSYFGTSYATILNIKGGTSQSHDKCLGTAMEYANRIFEKTGRNKDGITCYSSNNKQEILNIMATEVLNGKPVVIEVSGLKKSGKANVTATDMEGNQTTKTIDVYSRHYVTVFGVKQNANLSDLKESDFLILDPGSGTVKQLNTKSSNKKLSTRSLINANATTNNPYGNDYFISVYDSDSSKYESSSCKATTYESQDANKKINIRC